MNITVATSDAKSVDVAVIDIVEQLRDIEPSLLVAGFNTDLCADNIIGGLSTHINCPMIGASSCKGALGLSIEQANANAKASLSVMAIEDRAGHYGVGHCKISSDDGHDPFNAAKNALDMALYASGRGYESPRLIWCLLPPGFEEEILKGFADVVGENVPVFGGSSADNQVTGDWQQFTELSNGTNQICVAALYPSKPISTFFGSAYEPTDQSLVVTAGQQRFITTLNHEPAAKIYNQLAEECINECIGCEANTCSNGSKLLSLTTLHPLGKPVTSVAGIEDYLLSHPHAITQEGGLGLFTEIATNETLVLMRGDKQSLLTKAQRVISNAIALLPPGTSPGGVIMIYCAGCMLTIEDSINNLIKSFVENELDIPILGLYTFGEQGCFLDGVNRHGNLMISAVVFSK